MSTRYNEQNIFETGKPNKFTNGSFVQKTSQIWNEAPRNVKDAKTLREAKKAIRQVVKSLPR